MTQQQFEDVRAALSKAEYAQHFAAKANRDAELAATYARDAWTLLKRVLDEVTTPAS